MEESQHLVEPKPSREGREVANRRREAKDMLLGDEPPKFLSVAIVIVAILLGVVVVIARSIEYEETVPIALTLKAGESPNRIYGVAFLKQEEAARLRAGLAVRVEMSPRQARNRGLMEGSLNDISALNIGGFSSVRVDLPAELVTDSNLCDAVEQGTQMQAKVVTRKIRLFDRLFGVFRTLLGRG